MKIACSFIASKIPFIGSNTTPIRPFIGHNAPFSRFRLNQEGFTLMELMIALVILGILAALAAPGLRSINLNNRMVTETNDLLADMLFMRSEAIKRSKNIHMCKSTDTNVAQPVCDGTTTNPWTNGWIIWSDNDGSGALNYAGTTPDTLLRIGDGFIGANNAVTTTADGGGTQLANEIIITRLGLLGSGDSGFFSICDVRGASQGKRIDIAISGRPRINRNSAPSC